MVLLVLSFSDDDNIYRCSDFYDTISMMKNGGIANPIFHFNFKWKPLVFSYASSSTLYPCEWVSEWVGGQSFGLA